MRFACLQDVVAFESTPLAERNLPGSTYEVFQRTAAQYGGKVALRFLLNGKPDETPFNYTYDDLLKKITQTANALYRLGVKRDDVVSSLLPNLPQTHFALWGAEAAGIANPVNPLLEPEQIIEILNAAKTKVLITLAPTPNTYNWEKMAAMAAQIPSLTTVLTVDLQQFSAPDTHSAASTLQHPTLKIYDFDHFIAQQRDDILEHGIKIQPDDIASFFHTGGTTGTPKLAIHLHRNQVFSAWMVDQQLDWDANKIMHCGLPLFHVNAPLITGLAGFAAGAEIILTSPQGFRSDTVLRNFWKLVEKYKINFLMAVPGVYYILNKTWSAKIDTSSLLFATCGAAPMPTALIHEFQQHTGMKIVEGYGLTEGTVFSAVNPPYGERRVGSVGIRIPYQQVKTVKLDEHQQYVRDCAIDEPGTIAIKGANVFQGYLREADNKKIWLQDHWLNTGDVGRIDAQGYIWLTGRAKDIIIRGGHNIDPQIIEEALTKHPAVAMAAAVGKPDLKAGELPIAYVTFREGLSATEDELIEFTSSIISEHAAIPKHILSLDIMPVTAVGKIFKPALRADAIKRVFTERLQPLYRSGVEVGLSVLLDKEHGQVAVATLADKHYTDEIVDKIRSLLQGYPTAFKIEMA